MTSTAAKFYRLIAAVSTNTLDDEQKAYLTALLEDECLTELQTQELIRRHTETNYVE